MKAVTIIFALFALPAAFAKEGDPCTYGSLQGTCQNVSRCTSGFTVNNECPDDPENVKCCISKSCTSESSQPGTCLNNGRSPCSGTFVTGRCPGPDDVQCCVGSSAPPPAAPSVPSAPRPTVTSPNNDVVVHFWINAFIPLNVEGITKPWPKDRSKTMIDGIPIIGDCFLTDQRSFSSQSSAKARMHSETHVWIRPNGYDWSQEHYCDETTEVDCEDGDEEGKEKANNEGMSFRMKSGSSSKVVLDFKAAKNNPRVTLSPNIDLEGTLTVDRLGKFVEFVGKMDDFPAFEAYVSINGGAPRTIDTLGPKEGAGPESLAGGTNREFRGKVTF